MPKTCTKCKTPYESITENFYLDKNTRDGIRSWCKKCCKERAGNIRKQTLINLAIEERERVRIERDKYKIHGRTANKYLRIAGKLEKKLRWQEPQYIITEIKLCEL